MFKITVSLNNIMYVIKTLKNTDVFGYSFINKDTVRLICKKLKFIFVFFFKLKHFCCFDDRIIKFVTYTIYLILTIKNYCELTVFMFIISINNYFLILNKF